jgi:cell wall-associated NlpC family hydrolase
MPRGTTILPVGAPIAPSRVLTGGYVCRGLRWLVGLVAGLFATVFVLVIGASPAVAETQGEAIVAAAASQAGVTYCWGGGNEHGPTHGAGDWNGEAPHCTSPSTVGFDCTGLTQYAAYQGTGGTVDLTHHNSEQAKYAPGEWITSESALQPGDIVYFGYGRGDITHAAIYAGVVNGQQMIWDANTAWWIYPDGVYERTLASENGLGFVGAARVWKGNTEPPPQPMTRANLLRDGGFESGGEGWGRSQPAGVTVNYTSYAGSASAPAHDGARYEAANTSAAGGSFYQDVPVNMQEGDSATFSVWARVYPGQPLSGQYLNLCLWALSGGNKNACEQKTLTHQWQQLQATVTMPAATSTLRAQLYMYGSGDFNFDGASLGAPQTAEAVYPPVATGAPSVTGTTTVGSVLTCSPGAWASESNEPTSFAYAWMSDGSAIAGAIDSTYALTPDDAGHYLSCAITASNAAGSNTAGATPRGPVTAATSLGGSGGPGSLSPLIESSGQVYVNATESAGSVRSTTSKRSLAKALARCRKLKSRDRRAACQAKAKRRHGHQVRSVRHRRRARAMATCESIKNHRKRRACVAKAKRRPRVPGAGRAKVHDLVHHTTKTMKAGRNYVAQRKSSNLVDRSGAPAAGMSARHGLWRAGSRWSAWLAFGG